MAIVKFSDTEDFSEKSQDFHEFTSIINKLFELQGKKVNIDIPVAIASEIVKRKYSIAQLRIAVDRMLDLRFSSLGLPEFLNFLRDGSPQEKSVSFCKLCGEHFPSKKEPISTGFLEAISFHRSSSFGSYVSDSRVLCSCSHGKRLQRFWGSLLRFDGTNRKIEAPSAVYFVFLKNDPKWLAKQWRLKRFLQRA
jgi:hypothetical protein